MGAAVVVVSASVEVVVDSPDTVVVVSTTVVVVVAGSVVLVDLVTSTEVVVEFSVDCVVQADKIARTLMAMAVIALCAVVVPMRRSYTVPVGRFGLGARAVASDLGRWRCGVVWSSAGVAEAGFGSVCRVDDVVYLAL